MPDLQRRDPMPDVSALPGWLWRHLGRSGRIALGVVLLVAVGGLAVAIPAIDDDKQRTREREAALLARTQAATVAMLRRIQAPHRASAGLRLSLPQARAELQEQITADVRRRQRAGEIPSVPSVLRTTCTPVDTARAQRFRAEGLDYMRCLAVTSENDTVASGHEFIASTRAAAGRMVWCRSTALPGEKANAVVAASVRLDADCYRP